VDARAAESREKIERLATTSILDVWDKLFLEKQAREATSDLKLLGDLIAGAALATNGKDKAFDDALKDLAMEALRLLPRDDEAGLPGAEKQQREQERARLRPKLRDKAQALLQQGRGPGHSERTPLHWPLVFPEVFARGGFDAIVGNPPFQGGQRLTGALGTDYRDYLVRHLADGRRGSADLCAYFFLRAASLLRADGQFGLVATNTIAQGDTREVGLDALLASGCTLPRAVPSMKWPGEANLEVATVWLRKGTWSGAVFLEDRPVNGLTSQLTPPGRALGKPQRLKANEGQSFIGSYVLGLGFTMPPDQAAALIRKDPRNKDVLFPYLNGQDLNTHPEQQAVRWVINFFDWPSTGRARRRGIGAPSPLTIQIAWPLLTQRSGPSVSAGGSMENSCFVARCRSGGGTTQRSGLRSTRRLGRSHAFWCALSRGSTTHSCFLRTDLWLTKHFPCLSCRRSAGSRR
jgi:hypothetical protein